MLENKAGMEEGGDSEIYKAFTTAVQEWKAGLVASGIAGNLLCLTSLILKIQRCKRSLSFFMHAVAAIDLQECAIDRLILAQGVKLAVAIEYSS